METCMHLHRWHTPSLQKEKYRDVIPALFIKLRLKKQILTTLGGNGQGFDHFWMSAPNLSEEQIKAGIFDGSKRKNIEGFHFWGLDELK